MVDITFPTDAIAGLYVNTHASMVTTRLLFKQAWDKAYGKWVNYNDWNAKQAEAYFKVVTISDATTMKYNNPNDVSSLVI